MTPTTLKSIMDKQNLSNLDLATIVGVTDRQVRSWLTGAYEIPQLVSILLAALDEDLINQDWLINMVQQELSERV